MTSARNRLEEYRKAEAADKVRRAAALADTLRRARRTLVLVLVVAGIGITSGLYVIVRIVMLWNTEL